MIQSPNNQGHASDRHSSPPNTWLPGCFAPPSSFLSWIRSLFQTLSLTLLLLLSHWLSAAVSPPTNPDRFDARPPYIELRSTRRRSRRLHGMNPYDDDDLRQRLASTRPSPELMLSFYNSAAAAVEDLRYDFREICDERLATTRAVRTVFCRRKKKKVKEDRRTVEEVIGDDDGRDTPMPQDPDDRMDNAQAVQDTVVGAPTEESAEDSVQNTVQAARDAFLTATTGDITDQTVQDEAVQDAVVTASSETVTEDTRQDTGQAVHDTAMSVPTGDIADEEMQTTHQAVPDTPIENSIEEEVQDTPMSQTSSEMGNAQTVEDTVMAVPTGDIAEEEVQNTPMPPAPAEENAIDAERLPATSRFPPHRPSSGALVEETSLPPEASVLETSSDDAPPPDLLMESSITPSAEHPLPALPTSADAHQPIVHMEVENLPQDQAAVALASDTDVPMVAMPDSDNESESNLWPLPLTPTPSHSTLATSDDSERPQPQHNQQLVNAAQRFASDDEDATDTDSDDSFDSESGVWAVLEYALDNFAGSVHSPRQLEVTFHHMIECGPKSWEWARQLHRYIKYLEDFRYEAWKFPNHPRVYFPQLYYDLRNFPVRASVDRNTQPALITELPSEDTSEGNPEATPATSDASSQAAPELHDEATEAALELSDEATEAKPTLSDEAKEATLGVGDEEREDTPALSTNTEDMPSLVKPRGPDSLTGMIERRLLQYFRDNPDGAPITSSQLMRVWKMTEQVMYIRSKQMRKLHEVQNLSNKKCRTYLWQRRPDDDDGTHLLRSGGLNSPLAEVISIEEDYPEGFQATLARPERYKIAGREKRDPMKLLLESLTKSDEDE